MSLYERFRRFTKRRDGEAELLRKTVHSRSFWHWTKTKTTVSVDRSLFAVSNRLSQSWICCALKWRALKNGPCCVWCCHAKTLIWQGKALQIYFVNIWCCYMVCAVADLHCSIVGNPIIWSFARNANILLFAQNFNFESVCFVSMLVHWLRCILNSDSCWQSSFYHTRRRRILSHWTSGSNAPAKCFLKIRSRSATFDAPLLKLLLGHVDRIILHNSFAEMLLQTWESHIPARNMFCAASIWRITVSRVLLGPYGRVRRVWINLCLMLQYCTLV